MAHSTQISAEERLKICVLFGFHCRYVIKWIYCGCSRLISQFQLRTLWADPTVAIKDQERDNFFICKVSACTQTHIQLHILIRTHTSIPKANER